MKINELTPTDIQGLDDTIHDMDELEQDVMERLNNSSIPEYRAKLEQALTELKEMKDKFQKILQDNQPMQMAA